MSKNHNTPYPSLERSNEPIFWSLFGGGGVLSALFGPMLVLITAVLIPLGILLPEETMSYQRVLAFVQWWPGKLAVFVVVWLFLFHAAHRFGFMLHDFGVPVGHAGKLASYGAAAILTLICGYVLLQI